MKARLSQLGQYQDCNAKNGNLIKTWQWAKKFINLLWLSVSLPKPCFNKTQSVFHQSVDKCDSELKLQ